MKASAAALCQWSSSGWADDGVAGPDAEDGAVAGPTNPNAFGNAWSVEPTTRECQLVRARGVKRTSAATMRDG